jgi:hypothetical protein
MMNHDDDDDDESWWRWWWIMMTMMMMMNHDDDDDDESWSVANPCYSVYSKVFLFILPEEWKTDYVSVCFYFNHQL